MRKSIFVFYSIFLFQFCFVFSQQEVVKLTTNGYGQNENEAVTDALKMAVENSFGVYISTETQIINDELIKDEITSLGKGSILSYNITDQKKLGESNYIVTVDSEVSIVNLKTFAASKGVEVDFEGALFASNLKLQELNEQNEIKLVQSFIKELSREFRKSVEFTIKYDEPKFKSIDEMYDGWERNSGERYVIKMQVDAEVNENSKNIEEMLDYFSKSITMDIGEVENYIKLEKPVYPIYLALSEDRAHSKKNRNHTYFFLRTQEAYLYFMYNLFTMPGFYYSNFLLEDGLSEIYVYDVVYEGRGETSAKKLPVFWMGSDGSGFENNATKDALKSFINDVFKVPPGYFDKIKEDYLPYDIYNAMLKYRPSLNRRGTAFIHNFCSYSLGGRSSREVESDFASFPLYTNYFINEWQGVKNWRYGEYYVRTTNGLAKRPRSNIFWNNNYGIIPRLAKEKYGKDFGKKLRDLESSFITTWLYRPTIKYSYNEEQHLFSTVFDLYYTRDELSRVKKFSVKQNDLPFPLLKSFKYSRRAGGEYFFDLNKEESMNLIEFYKKVFLPKDYSIESRLKKIREELEKKKLD